MLDDCPSKLKFACRLRGATIVPKCGMFYNEASTKTVGDTPGLLVAIQEIYCLFQSHLCTNQMTITSKRCIKVSVQSHSSKSYKRL